MKSHTVPYAKRVHHTALAIVPPVDDIDCWTRLNDLRCRCRDKGFYRWPPHINLVYPFIDSSEFALFAEQLTHSMAKTAPFEVSLSRMDTFGGKNSGVCWLDPCTDKANIGNKDASPYETLSKLHARITSVLDGTEEDVKSDSGGAEPKKLPPRQFRPHLTFNHSPSLAAATAIVETERDDWTEVSFQVKELYLLERRQPDDQFRVVATVPLGVELRTSTVLEKPIERIEERCNVDGSDHIDSMNGEGGEEEVVSREDVIPSAEFFSPAMKFPLMPDTEEDWVKDVTRSLNRSRNSGDRTKKGAKGGRGRGGYHKAKK
mmetsp:Transcript_1769/g.3332  ORF Transcript_1769/g.3332 Transcript_1769/m.3332 type:complete len:318 (-) Transcript_1769:141-1094(-)